MTASGYPVCIAGGGPVGMTLAAVLASYGIRSVLVERNATTTRHPKMDITNARTMELFRALGLVPALRRVAVPEDHGFDVAWMTTMCGHELHRFAYPSVTEMRARIRELNDGSQPLEPPMRVSQVEIEPVLKAHIDAEPLIDVRFGVELEAVQQNADEVTVVVRDRRTDAREEIRCAYLAGCDGGGSRVRAEVGIGVGGQSNVMDRYMIHFRSSARNVLQRWGVAWHYQSNNGTLIAQNDRDLWTLHARFPSGRSPDKVAPSEMVERFVGATIEHEVLVANAWRPHLLVADHYRAGRVFLVGDAAHQYIPTGGYGMNTGIGDAFDLGWKLAASLRGFAGPGVLDAYESERRPVGLRNRDASALHNGRRIEIAALYGDGLASDDPAGATQRADVAKRIASIGNLENENTAIELGYCYSGSAVICDDGAEPPSGDRYVVNSTPGARLPSVFLPDGSALYDRLGPWFTLITFGGAPDEGIVTASERRGMPLRVLALNESLRAIYGARAVLVRPDHHIAWRCTGRERSRDPAAVVERVIGDEISAQQNSIGIGSLSGGA